MARGLSLGSGAFGVEGCEVCSVRDGLRSLVSEIRLMVQDVSDISTTKTLKPWALRAPSEPQTPELVNPCTPYPNRNHELPWAGTYGNRNGLPCARMFLHCHKAGREAFKTFRESSMQGGLVSSNSISTSKPHTTHQT